MKSHTNSNIADADDEIIIESEFFSDTIPYSPISLGNNYQNYLTCMARQNVSDRNYKQLP